MNLLRFHASWSPIGLAAAVGLGLLSGGSAAALLAVLNAAMADGRFTLGWGLWFVGLCGLRLVSGVVGHGVMIHLSQQALCELRTRLVEDAVESPLDRVEHIGRARVATAFGEDVPQVAQVAINVPYFLVNLVVLAGCLIYLGWVSPVVWAGFVVAAAGGVLSYLGPVVKANAGLRAAREEEGRLFAAFEEAMSGLKELKLHAGRREAFLRRAWWPTAEAVCRQNVRGIVLYAAAANWNRLLFFLYVGLLVATAPVWSTAAGAAVGPAGLAGMVVVLLYIMAPLEAVMNALPHLARADVALGRIDRLRSEMRAGERAVEPAADAGCGGPERIEWRSAGYTYAGERGENGFSVGPVDLTLERGQVVFLVGGNGAGKTTLLKLLTGLYPLRSGSAWVVGPDGPQPGDASGLVSAVFSEFHVFETLWGIEAATLERDAGRWIHELELRGKVSLRDGRLSTVDLSRGQRKRLALLVALLEDRPFYVLDEWAADQSPAFRARFYERILPMMAASGKGVLVATHDEAYFGAADRVVRLEGGRLVEEGEGCAAERWPAGCGAI